MMLALVALKFFHYSNESFEKFFFISICWRLYKIVGGI